MKERMQACMIIDQRKIENKFKIKIYHGGKISKKYNFLTSDDGATLSSNNMSNSCWSSVALKCGDISLKNIRESFLDS